jgi:hypothetical protein
MADVLLELDLPKTRLFVASCSELLQLRRVVQTSADLDLSRYELWERRQSGELVDLNLSKRRGSVLVVGRLKATEEPLCDCCGLIQSDFPGHLDTCRAGLLTINPLSSFHALYTAL